MNWMLLKGEQKEFYINNNFWKGEGQANLMKKNLEL